MELRPHTPGLAAPSGLLEQWWCAA